MRRLRVVVAWGGVVLTAVGGRDAMDSSSLVRAEVRISTTTESRRLTTAQVAEDDDELRLEVLAVDAGAAERLLGAAARLRLALRRDTSAFAENYREVHWSKDRGFEVRSVGPPRCFYSGDADDGRGTARASLCGDKLRAFVRTANASLELVYADSIESYVLLDARRHQEQQQQQAPENQDPLGRKNLQFLPPLRLVGDGDEEDPMLHRQAVKDDDDDERDDPQKKSRGRRKPEEDRRRSQGISCDAQPTKIVENVIFNDASRYAELGYDVEADSARIFDLARDIWFAGESAFFGTQAEGFGVHEPGVFDCTVEPKLIGQVTWRSNPEEIEYIAGDECHPTCSRCFCNQHNFGCGPSEVDAPCLLQSIWEYAHVSHRAFLEEIFGDNEIDAAHLLSHRDFSGGTIGLAPGGAMCAAESATIVQISGWSTALTARILAHEMGHLFNMLHVDSEPNIMQSGQKPAEGDYVKFAKSSKYLIDDWMNSAYAYDACMENEPNVVDPWANGTSICGDGVVQDDEECDVGGIMDDAFCCGGRYNEDGFACKLLPGCECANHGDDACCRDGVILPRGTVCRPRVHDECDDDDKCDGESPDCPINLYASPGTECFNSYDDDAFVVAGRCHKGDCQTADDECLTRTNGDKPFACAASGVDIPFSVGCQEITCTNHTDRLSGCVANLVNVSNGIPCSSSTVEEGQCVIGEELSECSDFHQLKRYFWDRTDCRCRDETGDVVEDVLQFCGDFDRRCNSVAPTATPAPSITATPSSLPTTYAPTTQTPTSRHT